MTDSAPDSDPQPPEAAAPVLESVPGWLVVRLLGHGGAGWVHEAVRRSDGERAALKLLHVGEAGEERKRRLERASRELEALRRLDHPHVVRLVDADLEGQPAWIAMELLGGGSIADLIARLAADTPRSLGEVAAAWPGLDAAAAPSERADPAWGAEVNRLGVEVASALAAAHAEGIVHRDLKPSNVLLDRAGHARLCDFGTAALGDRARLTRTGDQPGTPLYLAPERLDAELGPVGPATDVHGLGLVLFELLLGQPLHLAEHAHEVGGAIRGGARKAARVLDGLPEGLRPLGDAIEVALRTRPAERWADGAAFESALKAAAEGRSVSAPRRGRRRRRVILGALALAGVLGAGGYSAHRVANEAARGGGEAAPSKGNGAVPLGSGAVVSRRGQPDRRAPGGGPPLLLESTAAQALRARLDPTRDEAERIRSLDALTRAARALSPAPPLRNAILRDSLTVEPEGRVLALGLEVAARLGTPGLVERAVAALRWSAAREESLPRALRRSALIYLACEAPQRLLDVEGMPDPERIIARDGVLDGPAERRQHAAILLGILGVVQGPAASLTWFDRLRSEASADGTPSLLSPRLLASFAEAFSDLSPSELRRFLGDPSRPAKLRIAVLDRLGVRTPISVWSMVGTLALRDADPAVRSGAIRALGRSQREPEFSLLQTLRRVESDPGLRLAASLALARAQRLSPDLLVEPEARLPLDSNLPLWFSSLAKAVFLAADPRAAASSAGLPKVPPVPAPGAETQDDGRWLTQVLGAAAVLGAVPLSEDSARHLGEGLTRLAEARRTRLRIQRRMQGLPRALGLSASQERLLEVLLPHLGREGIDPLLAILDASERSLTRVLQRGAPDETAVALVGVLSALARDEGLGEAGLAMVETLGRLAALAGEDDPFGLRPGLEDAYERALDPVRRRALALALLRSGAGEGRWFAGEATDGSDAFVHGLAQLRGGQPVAARDWLLTACHLGGLDEAQLQAAPEIADRPQLRERLERQLRSFERP